MKGALEKTNKLIWDSLKKDPILAKRYLHGLLKQRKERDEQDYIINGILDLLKMYAPHLFDAE